MTTQEQNTFTPDTGSDFNLYSLEESVAYQAAYSNIRSEVRGALSLTYGHDIPSKFKAAQAALSPNAGQDKLLSRLQEALLSIEKEIEPEKLELEPFRKGSDDEIYIIRHSDKGVSKIIVHDDGLLAYSFIGFKGCTVPDDLVFVHDVTALDFESFAYRFLAY